MGDRQDGTKLEVQPGEAVKLKDVKIGVSCLMLEVKLDFLQHFFFTSFYLIPSNFL